MVVLQAFYSAHRRPEADHHLQVRMLFPEKFFSNYVKPFSALLFVGLLSTAGQAVAEKHGFWSLQIENDLLGNGDDHFYTSGWQFSYTSRKSLPEYLEKVTDSISFYSKNGSGSGFYGVNLGQKIFTPEDIEQSALIVDDRPYAGWLYIESYIGHRYLDLDDRESINGITLTLGIVGPAALGEETQSAIHELTGSDEANGWDNQLENELGLNISFLQQWRFLNNIDEHRQSEIRLHTGLTLGNVYTYGSLGLMLRWGTYLKDDIGPPSITPGFPGLPSFNPDRRANWYLFAGFELRAVARDIFLDGNTNVDSHSVDKENLVGDLQFGIAMRLNGGRISFSQMVRSEEFEGQSDHTQFGLINFTLFVE